jgi:hypothetical protein
LNDPEPEQKKRVVFQPPNYGAGLVFRNSRVVSKLREFSKRGSVSGGSPITITLTNRSFFRTRSRPTDDQAAQVYVAWVRAPESVRSRIIGYVWDSTAPAGTVCKSEKSGTVTYIVVRSGAEGLGKWITERRNVAEDFRRIYGEAPDKPTALALAIDSDDTRSSAESFIGPTVFTPPRQAECPTAC